LSLPRRPEVQKMVFLKSKVAASADENAKFANN